MGLPSGCGRLPRKPEGTHICRQPLRSGTAEIPKYAVGRAAERGVDFAQKPGIGVKELNESPVWLRMSERHTTAPAQENARMDKRD
jgi:hypothetical protein